MTDLASPAPAPPAGGFALACAKLEELHRQDPRTGPGGEPESVVYHRRMAARLDAIEPDAGEELRLAARAQHVRRWTIPRSGFAAGRRGYLAWRNACKRMHADVAAEVLAAAGYGEAAIARVRDLVRKRRLRDDPEAQTLEDVACLVFLEGDLAGFAAGYRGDEAQLIAILRKTWSKMSPRGRHAALTLELPAAARRLVERALADG